MDTGWSTLNRECYRTLWYAYISEISIEHKHDWARSLHSLANKIINLKRQTTELWNETLPSNFLETAPGKSATPIILAGSSQLQVSFACVKKAFFLTNQWVTEWLASNTRDIYTYLIFVLSLVGNKCSSLHHLIEDLGLDRKQYAYNRNHGSNIRKSEHHKHDIYHCKSYIIIF